jgi:hypothetical protein
MVIKLYESRDENEAPALLRCDPRDPASLGALSARLGVDLAPLLAPRGAWWARLLGRRVS